MTEALTRPDQGGPGNTISERRIGSALVLHLNEPVTEEAQQLALSVPQDDDNDIVVLDLPARVPFARWQALTETWPRRRRRGLRLLPAGESDGTAPLVAHWLAQRLRCTVYAPDGRLVRTGAGHLFVGSDPDGGWLRFVPGKAPVPAGRRYPTPPWDAAVAASRTLRDTVAAEPLPGGVWIRDGRDAALLDRHRDLLHRASPCDPGTIGVILGCPGGAAVRPEDVVRFCATLPDTDRMRLRFAGYGPVELPDGDRLGQALADALDVNVVCYAGLPLTSPYLDATYTVRADGSTGWPTFARELGFAPRVLPFSLPKPPVILSHRPPPGTSEEIEPRIFRYESDVIVEVVEAGLWVRPAQQPAHADTIRAVAAEPDRCAVIVDDTAPAAGPALREAALREAALRLAERLTAVDVRSELRAASELVQEPPDALFDQPVPPAPPEVRWNEPTPLPTTPRTPVRPSPEPATQPAPPQPAPPQPAPVESVVVEPAPDQPAPAESVVVEPVPDQPAPAESVVVEPVPVEPVPVEPVPVEPVPVEPVPVEPVPAAPVPAESVPVEPVVVEPVPVQPVVVEPVVVEPVPAGPDLVAPSPPQPVPPPEPPVAGPPLPAGPPPLPVDPPPLPVDPPQPDVAGGSAGRLRALVADFDPAADLAAVADRITPGLNGWVASEEEFVEATALAWYLSPNGAHVDVGLRRGADGSPGELATYVEAALERLPVHRGVTTFALSPSPRHWEMYGTREVIADWGFLHALAAPCTALPGDTDVLLWSLTARRTDLCEPDDDVAVDSRVLFLPGTHFKLLDLRPPGEGRRRGRVVLRELAADEVSADGTVDSRHVARDGETLDAIRRTWLEWRRTPQRRRVGPSATGRFDHLPGLV
ncbi:hypothetical protein [Jidongwangia harbinensis]|uniref:hypothetical protein n=1 Tax=Jidongwangia harbinensis TaxID=2878561 RepID=UPI001CDA0144|nr:hypothetical protein [Jidongwangia harbinensis]MCA2211844.1 hypothetical protein [Jidongwangia harbinensis]